MSKPNQIHIIILSEPVFSSKLKRDNYSCLAAQEALKCRAPMQELFLITITKDWKNEQLKFTINVYNKKWLISRQNFIFDVIFQKFQFSVIFRIFFSVFANFCALKSVKQFRIWNMLNNRSKPS